MQLDVTLTLNEKLKTLDISQIVNPLARGWVEIENAIKFPVRVMKYHDKEDNTEKMFVSLPQKKSGDEYDDIVSPVSNEIRTELQDKVLAEFTKQLTNSVVLNTNVTDVKVHMLKEPIRTGTIHLMAMASVTLCGFKINGIQVKEGSKGLFVQMPQHKTGNEYHDTVYGANALIQQEIRDQVLAVYDVVSKEQKKILKKQEEAADEPVENSVPNFGTETNADMDTTQAEDENATVQPVPQSAPKRHRLV